MWGCNEYEQCRYSRERKCRVSPSYCPNKQIESCRNECTYSPNNYNICTEQTLRWLCRYRLENRRSCSAPPRRRLLTYEGGTLAAESRGKSPRRPSKTKKSCKMSPRKKSCTKIECPLRDRSPKKPKKETCPKTQCVLSDKDRKNMEEKLRSLRTCGQPGCQASRQKKQIEEAIFGTTMKCNAPSSPCCTEKVKTQVSLKAKAYEEETQVSLIAKSYKEEKKSSLVQDHEYLYFMLGITEDILKNNKYTVDEMEKVFNSHIAAHKGRLVEAKMKEHIDHLKKHLNYPTCVCDEQVGTDDDCRCCPALTIDHETKERRKCSCEDARCPANTISESAVVKREESGVKPEEGGLKREGSGVKREESGVKREGSGTVKREGSGVKREGSEMKREGSGVKREGSGVKREGSGVKREESGVKREGSGVKREGSGVKREGSGMKREGSGVGGTNVGSREGSGVVRKPSVEGGGEKGGNEKLSQELKSENTGSSTRRIWKEENGTVGGHEDDIKKKSHGATGKGSSAQEVKTIKSSLSVEKRVSGGSKETNSQTAADNIQECIDPAVCSTNPGNAPATSLSKANFTISGIDKLRIRETGNGGKSNGKTEDKLSEVVFYNPEVGSTCHCTIAIRKTALKIQSDGDADNEEYVLVEGPVCMPKKMLEQKTVPVLIENISSMLLDSDSNLRDHQKREGPSDSRVNLFQSGTARNNTVVDANLADSISGYITIADLKKTKEGDSTIPQREKSSFEEKSEYDRTKGGPRQSIVQIKPNVSYISISVSIASKSTGSDQTKIDETKKVSSDQAKNDKEIVSTNRKDVLTKENSSVYHERGGDDMLNHQQADEVKTMSEPKMKTDYSYMSYAYESWTRLITSDADIKYFTSGHDKKGFVIKPPPRQMKAHIEGKNLSCNSGSSEEIFCIPRRVKSENMKEEVILNDLDKLLQNNDSKILYVERLLTDADKDFAILRNIESATEISNNTLQSNGNKFDDTETNDCVDGKPENINTVRSLYLEGNDVENKMKSGSVASINNETRVSQNNIVKQQESLGEISKTNTCTKTTVCAEAKETETLLSQVKVSNSGKSSGSSINDQTSLEVQMKGSKSKDKLTNNNQADYKTALARFEHLKPKLKNITITKSDPTQDRHASTTFRLCTGEKTQSDSIHVVHIRFPKSREVMPKLDTLSADGVIATTDEPPSLKDLSDFRNKYHYLLKDAVTNVSSTDLCNIDDAFKEKPKEQIQVTKDPQIDVPCETLMTLEPETIPPPIATAMPVLVPSVPILEEAQHQGGSSSFYFPQLGTGYLSQTHDKKRPRPPDSIKDTHPTKCSVTNAEISKEENLPRIFEFSNRGQKRSMDFASRPGGENCQYGFQRKRKSLTGMESSAPKNPVLDKENSYRSPIPFPTNASSVSSTDDRSSLSETSVMLLKNKEKPTTSLNLEGDDHAEIIAQLDEIPEPDRTPNQISTIRDVTMKMEDFRTVDPRCIGRKFLYTNAEKFNIRRESFEY